MAHALFARRARGLLSGSFARVFAFTFRHWGRNKAAVGLVVGAMLLETAAHVLLPLFSGRIVDA
ncbi:MAG: hypothetical protein J0H54_00250, partial [Rhizobiales bacterium]|nr:hypothetical protein [Hyphomicrobiales bacterium]